MSNNPRITYHVSVPTVDMENKKIKIKIFLFGLLETIFSPTWQAFPQKYTNYAQQYRLLHFGNGAVMWLFTLQNEIT